MPVDGVSVIVPTNRVSPYLEAALRSVAAQTSPAREVIVVDDGSPDEALPRLAAAFGARYLHNAGKGVSAARNTGAAAATGAWLCFLDDDDVWHPDKLALQLDALGRRPDAVCCASGGRIIDGDGEPTGDEWDAPDASTTAMLRGVAPIPRIVTLVVSRAAFVRIGGFDETMRQAEDNDLILRLVAVGAVATVDRALTDYRRHSFNVSGGGYDGLDAGIGFLRRQIARARAANAPLTAAMLEQNLARVMRGGGAAVARDALAQARRGAWRGALSSLGWGMRHLPRHTLSGLGARLVEPARRRR